jgi:large subunit ribosomal protein L3
MALGLLAKKRGMTRFRDDKGDMIPVTVLEVGPCTVVAQRTEEAHGYVAVQIAFEAEKKKNRTTRAVAGHYAKAKVPVHRNLGEFRGEGAEDLIVGQLLTAEAFRTGERVNIQGTVKGRGFQGVIKRHNKAGGPASHGSHFHRSTGSIGQCAWPAHTFKNMKMPGQMGNVTRTTRNLEIVSVDPELNMLLVRGAVPGATNGLVRIETQAADFVSRCAERSALSDETKTPNEEQNAQGAKPTAQSEKTS